MPINICQNQKTRFVFEKCLIIHSKLYSSKEKINIPVSNVSAQPTTLLSFILNTYNTIAQIILYMIASLIGVRYLYGFFTNQIYLKMKDIPQPNSTVMCVALTTLNAYSA